MTLITALKSTRPPFLILTLACVFLGASMAYYQQQSLGKVINIMDLALVFIGAMMAHISVNSLNEYLDFKSGLDFNTHKTPFSGGSGSLPENPHLANTVLGIALVSLFITTGIGLYFIWKSGPDILPIGLAGIGIIISYTGPINRNPWACLIAPGLGFGILMVMGTQLVLSGELTTAGWLTGLVTFFLVNNLLLLNQYPDIQADTAVGRNHFPIAYSTQKSNIVYAVFIIATLVLIEAGVFFNILPTLSLIAVVPVCLAFFSLKGAIQHQGEIGQYPIYQGINVAVTIFTPLLLGISLLAG